MKQTKIIVRVISLLIFFLFVTTAQGQQNDKPRASLKAGVFQRIGVDTDINISYSRPGVKGREIWGGLVPYGLAPGDKESHDKPFPWRGGANECTTIEFNKDVMINGNKLPVGKYSMQFIPSPKEWVVIFNKNTKLWGSFDYDQKDDALRINVSPVEAPFQEWLSYGFDNLAGTSCTAYMRWEKLKVPFNISTAD
ncbi:MAG: DUF2911 domain-containing protein [Ignavibacteriaceae bacterium]